MKTLMLFLFVVFASFAAYDVSIQYYGIATFQALVSISCLFAAYDRS